MFASIIVNVLSTNEIQTGSIKVDNITFYTSLTNGTSTDDAPLAETALSVM